MDLNISCGSWIKAEDEQVLNLLRSSDVPLSPEELAQRTGLSIHRVRKTLRMLAQQQAHQACREKLLEELR